MGDEGRGDRGISGEEVGSDSVMLFYSFTCSSHRTVQVVT